jgi:hypothetical protein
MADVGSTANLAAAGADKGAPAGGAAAAAPGTEANDLRKNFNYPLVKVRVPFTYSNPQPIPFSSQSTYKSILWDWIVLIKL